MRVAITEAVANASGGEDRKVTGTFNLDAARKWSDYDPVSRNGSGGAGRGQHVCRTARGKWVLCDWTNWQGEKDVFEYISADQARDWLLANGENEAVEEFFPDLEEEEDFRNPGGRPEIGGHIGPTNLGDDLLARVDGYRKELRISRAEAIRVLLNSALDAREQGKEGEVTVFTAVISAEFDSRFYDASVRERVPEDVSANAGALIPGTEVRLGVPTLRSDDGPADSTLRRAQDEAERALRALGYRVLSRWEWTDIAGYADVEKEEQ